MDGRGWKREGKGGEGRGVVKFTFHGNWTCVGTHDTMQHDYAVSPGSLQKL